MIKKRLAIFLTSFHLIMSGSLLNAQEPQSTSNVEVEDVVIIATKTPSELDKVGGSTVHIITDQDIEEKKEVEVKELLKEVPGIDVSSSGGAGAATSIFIRGSDNKNTLVLIDGIMFNDPSSGNRSSNIANMTLDNIERIEIIKGSQSVLYGSNATAGVINIITKKGKGKPVITANVEGGSYETLKYSLGARGSMDTFNFSIVGSQTKVGGFSTANDRNDDIPHDGNTDEKDSWENQTISARLGYDVSENFDLTFVLRKIDSKLYYDDWGDGYAGDRLDYNSSTYSYTANPDGDKDRHDEQEQLYYGITLHNLFFDKSFESTLRYNIGSDYRERYDNDNDKINTYTGKSTDANWQGTVFIGSSQEITIGAGLFTEYMEQESISSGSTTKDIDKSATTSSYWIQDKLMLLNDDLIIPIGVRSDNHDKFGQATTYRLAPSFRYPGSELTFKASYGTGFQAPSLFNLYSSYGDEDLEAEKSETVDCGFEYRIRDYRAHIELTAFHNRFENQIAYNFSTSKYANEDGVVKTSGYEITALTQLSDDTNIRFSVVHTKTENDDGDPLVRRPENKYTFSGRTKLMDKLTTRLTMVYVGERDAISSAKDKDGNQVDTLDAYGLVDLTVTYVINEQVKLYAKGKNLTDTFYEDEWSYATPGRSAYAGINATF